MRYVHIPPAIIRRAMTVYLGSTASDMTPVYFRIPEQTDSLPYYLINWFIDSQDFDKIWEREEQLAVTCVTQGANDLYSAAVAKTKALDFFQREATVRELNRIISYIETTDSVFIPYTFKYLSVEDSGDEIAWSEDGMRLTSTFFVKYCVTFDQESLSSIELMTDNQIAQYDV